MNNKRGLIYLFVILILVSVVYGIDPTFGCNADTDGAITDGGTHICVYDLENNFYHWVEASTDYFKIYDIANKTINVISNSEEWFYCSANPIDYNVKRYECSLSGIDYNDLVACEAACLTKSGAKKECHIIIKTSQELLSQINPIIELGTFNDITIASTSPYLDSDFDGCSDAEEFPEFPIDDPTKHPLSCTGPIQPVVNEIDGAITTFLDSSNCQNNNINNCLSDLLNIVQAENIEETQNQNYDIISIPPISVKESDSYICYTEGDKHYIAECCSIGKCSNDFRVDNGAVSYYDSPFKAVGNGVPLRVLLTGGDYWDGIKVIDKVPKILSSYNIKTKNMNLADYDTLTFFIVFNFGENINIEIKDNDGDISSTLNIKDYKRNWYTPFRWHKIQIPFDEFKLTKDELSQITDIRLFIDPITNNNQAFLLDDVYVTVFNENDYFCNGFYGTWLDELDPEESDNDFNNNLDVYKIACDGVPSYGWTGTQCCGDDNNEYFTDLIGGCYNSYPVMDENTLSNAVNDPDLSNILYANGSFYQCNYHNNLDQISYGNMIVNNVNKCVVPGSNYFCDINNKWNNEPVYGYANQLFLSNTRTEYKKISNESFEMTSNLNSIESCCPQGFCWDGNRCIDGRSNVTGINYIPDSYVYLYSDEILKDKKSVVCTDGEWQMLEKKYSPHYDYSAYCWDNSQCYYQDLSGNANCYDSGEYAVTSKGITDFYCESGSWVSRTKKLADKLLSVNTGGDAYTLICDDTDIVLNLLYANISGAYQFIQTFAADANEVNNINPICALIIDKTNDDIFGNANDLVVLGTPLKKSWQEINQMQTSDFFWNVGSCSQEFSYNDEYMPCNNNIYYNNITHTIIFSQQDISSLSFSNSRITKFFTLVKKWFLDFLKLGKNVQGMDDFQALVKLKYSIYNNMLYNHMYYYEGKGKSISAVKEYKWDLNEHKYKYLIYSKYDGFVSDICDSDTIEGYFLTPNNAKKITCSDDDRVIVQEFDPIDLSDISYWKDLTAKIRTGTALCQETIPSQCGISNVGQCQYGQRNCQSGEWSACNGAIYPIEELCDGLDNDCDGQIDEDLIELCDGLDNDCDGQIDEGEVCSKSCVGPDGVNILDGDLKLYYKLGLVSYDEMCESELRYCINEELNGSYNYSTCQKDKPNDCIGPDNTIIYHDHYNEYYFLDKVNDNTYCDLEIRSCNNGTLSGNYTYSDCNININYTWDIGNWGSCSQSCGGGIHTRVVDCQTDFNEVVYDKYCDIPKPATIENCNLQKCESCDDGIKNQDEQKVDLGGVCGVPPNFFISRHVDDGYCASSFLGWPLQNALPNDGSAGGCCLYDTCSDGRGFHCFYGDKTSSAAGWTCATGKYIYGSQPLFNWGMSFVNFDK